MSGLLRLQNSGNRHCLPAPFSRFAVQPLSSMLRQSVVLSSPAVLGGFPLASDRPGSLQALERHKQRTRIHMEHAVADLFDADGNSISVHGLQRQRFQMSMSSVPCTRSLGLSAMKTLPPEKQRENTPFILIVKRSKAC
jgi:hypothetical protein